MSETTEVLDEILYTLRDIKELLEKQHESVYNVTIVDDKDTFTTTLDDIRRR